ncbi:MAG: hypothetical protein LBV22_03885 [Mycoplasmataceae bacterium]|nr:hypothetical protein [Mycoplasmataceae bacterium]
MTKKHTEDTSELISLEDAGTSVATVVEGTKEEPLGWLIDSGNNKYPVTIISPRKDPIFGKIVPTYHFWLVNGKKRYATKNSKNQFVTIKSRWLVAAMVPLMLLIVLLWIIFEACCDYYYFVEEHSFMVSLAVFTGLRDMSVASYYMWGGASTIVLIGVIVAIQYFCNRRIFKAYELNPKMYSSSPTQSSHDPHKHSRKGK